MYDCIYHIEDTKYNTIENKVLDIVGKTPLDYYKNKLKNINDIFCLYLFDYMVDTKNSINLQNNTFLNYKLNDTHFTRKIKDYTLTTFNNKIIINNSYINNTIFDYNAQTKSILYNNLFLNSLKK